jgi:hypothetical protein
MWKRFPLGVTVLGAIGAILIVLEGVFFVGTLDYIPPAFIFGYGVTVSAATMGLIAIIEGSLALCLMLLVYAEPGAHVLVGIGAISLALLSLFTGGGFLLGALILWVSGAVTIYFGLREGEPETVASPADRFEDDEPARTVG